VSVRGERGWWRLEGNRWDGGRVGGELKGDEREGGGGDSSWARNGGDEENKGCGKGGRGVGRG